MLTCSKCNEEIEPHVAHVTYRRSVTGRKFYDFFHPECCADCMAKLQKLEKVATNVDPD